MAQEETEAQSHELPFLTSHREVPAASPLLGVAIAFSALDAPPTPAAYSSQHASLSIASACSSLEGTACKTWE